MIYFGTSIAYSLSFVPSEPIKLIHRGRGVTKKKRDCMNQALVAMATGKPLGHNKRQLLSSVVIKLLSCVAHTQKIRSIIFIVIGIMRMIFSFYLNQLPILTFRTRIDFALKNK